MHQARRRALVSALVVSCLVVIGLGVPSQVASASSQTATIVSDNPANYTPNVLDGSVKAIAQVGNRIIIGGDFTQIASADGATTYNRPYLAAFDATTGAVDTGFAPVLDGLVNSVISAGDGTSVYVGGQFSTLNGGFARRVTRINVSTGLKVSGWSAGSVNAEVKDLRLVGSTLYMAGYFTTVQGAARSRMASLDAATGTLNSKLNLSVSGTQNGGTTNIYKFDVTPAGDRLLMIGNFATVDGQARRQVAMLDLSGPTATLAPWATTFYTSTCAGVFDSYMRDLDISEDGSYAVISTTGAFVANSACDSISRFPIYSASASLTPTWVNYTGGDTTYAVEIARGVVYVGGHMRWLNNPFAGDAAGPGAVAREGIAALDPVNGLPFSWNPGRERGVGVFDFLATPTGLWAGSDTDRWNSELHAKVAFFPYAGGTSVPADAVASLPNDVYLFGRTGSAASDPSVLYRVNTGGPALPSADDGPDWQADASTTFTYRNSGSNTASYSAVPTVDAAVPNADIDRAPRGLYETERWDPQDLTEMQWSFPVPSGTPIEVRLYLANRCSCTASPGQRRFDVDLDGVQVLDDLDLSASPGHDIGTMRAFTKSSDGSVDIRFRHVTENPLINGIEILRTDVPKDAGASLTDDVQRRYLNPGSAPGAALVTPGAEAFHLARGGFMIGSMLYTGWSDGTFVKRTFNGTAFGTRESINLFGGGFASDLPTITGMTYDPADARIYYTMTGSSSLFWRSFTPESGIVGSSRFTATGDVATMNPARVNGLILSGGQLYFADSTSGNLLSVGFAGGAVTGGVSTIDTTADWRARAMVAWVGKPLSQPNVPPTASFAADCTDLTCSLDASASTDPDGTIVSYSWDFGDGQTATGATASHLYGEAGSYTITLTVTDSDGASVSTERQVEATAPGYVVTYRASSTQNGNLTSASVTVPAGVETGDTLLLFVTAAANTTITTPAGWTLRGTVADPSPDTRSWFFQRTATAGLAGTSVPVSFGARVKESMILLAYSGTAFVPVTAFASAEVGSSTTQVPAPTVAVASSGSTVVSYWANESAGNAGWTLPGLVAQRASSLGSGAGQITAAAGDTSPVAPGTWPGATATSPVASGKAPSWSVVLAPDGPNAAPTASFTSSCTGLVCSFDASASSDSDGTIAAYDWDFGDGQTATGATASHTFAAQGTYPITLTVTDNDAATGTQSADVSVEPIVYPPIAYRAGSTSNRTATTSSVAIPASVQTGDALLLFVTANVNTSVTTPAGWTLQGTVADGTPDLRSWLFSRTASAGLGGTNVSVTLGASSKVDMTVVAYANTAASPVGGAASGVETSTSATHASPSVDVATDGSVVVSYWADKTAGTTSWTPADPVIERTESLGTGSGQVSSVSGDTSGVPVGTWAGATATSSTSSAKAVSWSVVLTPAS